MSKIETVSQKIAAKAAQEHLNVLIVEDDLGMLELLAEIMREAAKDIRAAQLCVEILQKLPTKDEIIFRDWQNIDVVLTTTQLETDASFGQNLVNYLAKYHPQILLIGTAAGVNEPRDVDAYLDKGDAYILPELRKYLLKKTRGRWNTPLPR